MTPILALGLGGCLVAAGLMSLSGNGPARQADSAALSALLSGQSHSAMAWFRREAEPPITRRFEANRAWLTALATVEPERRAAWLDAGIADLSAQLLRRPTDGHAWMVWAWLRNLREGFGPAVLDGLRQSYAHGRFEMLISMDRVYLTLGLLPALPADLRREALLEARLMGNHRLNTRFLFRLADAAAAAGPETAQHVIEQAAGNDALSAGLMTSFIAEARRARGYPP